MDTIDNLISLGKTDLIAFTDVLHSQLTILSSIPLPDYINYILREVVAHYLDQVDVYCVLLPRIVNTVMKFYNKPLETDGMRYIISLYLAHIHENNFVPDILDVLTKSVYFELIDTQGVKFAISFMRELVNYLINKIASRKLTNNPIEVSHKIIYELPHGSYINEKDIIASCDSTMSAHLLNKLLVISKQEQDLSISKLIFVGQRDMPKFMSLIENLGNYPELAVYIDSIAKDVLCYYAKYDQKSKFVLVLDSVINIAMKLGLDYYIKLLRSFTYNNNYYPPYVVRLYKVFALQHPHDELIKTHITYLESLSSNNPLSVTVTLIQLLPFDNSDKYLSKAKELQDTLDMRESPRTLNLSC